MPNVDDVDKKQESKGTEEQKDLNQRFRQDMLELTQRKKTYKEIKEEQVQIQAAINKQIIIYENIISETQKQLDAKKATEANLRFAQDSLDQYFEEYAPRGYKRNQELTFNNGDSCTDDGQMHLIGTRNVIQQDATCKSKLSENFTSLTKSEQKHVLDQTVKQLQEKNQDNKFCGSTLCSTIVWKENKKLHIRNLNVGDSTSYLVVYNKKGVVKDKCFRINRTLHGCEGDNRLQTDKCKISVTHAIGDTGGYASKDKKIEMKHDGDFYSDDIDLKSDETAVVVTACDGLTEKIKNIKGIKDENERANTETTDIAQCVFENRSKSLYDLNFALVKHAFEGGGEKRDPSSDNISIVTSIVSELKDGVPELTLVADGHGVGGEHVSKSIEVNFSNLLQENIRLLVEKKEAAALAFNNACDELRKNTEYTKSRAAIPGDTKDITSHSKDTKTDSDSQNTMIDPNVAKTDLTAIQTSPDSPLKSAGRGVLEAAINIKREGVTIEELKNLTQFVKGTTEIVINPGSETIRNHQQNTAAVLGMKRSKWKLLAGAMLAVLGVALITVAVSSIVMSFGATTPAAVPLIAIGTTTIKAAGVTMGIFGATTGLTGVAGLAVMSYGLFSEKHGIRGGLKGDLAVAGKRVLEEAKKQKPS